METRDYTYGGDEALLFEAKFSSIISLALAANKSELFELQDQDVHERNTNRLKKKRNKKDILISLQNIQYYISVHTIYTIN